MKKLNDLSLRKKFITSLLLFLFLPLVIASIIINNNFRNYYFSQSCDSNLQVLKQVHKGVENFTKDAEFVSLNILSDTTVQDLIKIYKGNYSSSAEREKLNAGFTIQSLLQSRNFVSSISLYDDKNIIFQFGDRVVEEDSRYNDAVRALKGRPYWTGAYQFDNALIENKKEYVVSLLRVINDLHSVNHVLGMERISVKEDYICTLYDSINTDHGTMFVINADGNIVSSTDKKMIGTSFTDKNRFFGSIKADNGYFSDQGKMYFYSMQSDPDWILVKTVPLSELYASGDIASRILFLCIGLIVVFAAAFLLILNKSIIRPVVKLAQEADRFRDGNFQIAKYTKSDDEIGRLNSALFDMGEYIRNLIELEYKAKLSQREMELEYMNSQINPHFLYNALDSIRWMAIKEKNMDVARQIEALSNLFRHNLNRGKRKTTLREEIKHLENYITIQKNRYEDKISFITEVDNDLLDCVVTKLLLQPLVENAIVHGLEEKVGKGTVKVEIKNKDGKIMCSVSDDGIGADEEIINAYILNAEETSRVFALKNINDRIKLEYGEEYGLVFESSRETGTKVTVTLPIIRPNV